MNAISRSFCLLVGAATIAGARTSADSTPPRRSSNWTSAFVLGLPGYRSQIAEPALTTMGFHFTDLTPGKLGGDVAFGLLPYGLGYGVVVLGLRGGVALPMQAGPELYLIPAAGLSTLGALGAGGGGGLFGVNAGFGILTGTPERGGMRVNLSWHRFGEAVDEAVWLLEVGWVFRKGGKPR